MNENHHGNHLIKQSSKKGYIKKHVLQHIFLSQTIVQTSPQTIATNKTQNNVF
jgi:hypothetical protein